MLKWSNRSYYTGLLSGIGSGSTSQHADTGEAKKITLLDAEDPSRRSFFCQRATVSSIPFEKERQNACPSLDRQAWTITISTEKKKNKIKVVCWLTSIFSE